LPRLIKLRDMAKAGRKLLLPLLNREIPLVTDLWAKPELGTGCVKITPAHDPNDYEVGKRQSLPMINILNPDGTLNEHAGAYQGLKNLVARERVVADLDALGLLGDVEDREIEIAHSDRSKTPIEPFLADQWFVKMDRLAQSAMDAVSDGRVKIFPQRYARGYLDWLGEKRDWPIGRQLWWGHRIPIWPAPTVTEAELKQAFAGRNDVSWQRDEERDQWLICAQETDLAPDAIQGHTIHQDNDVLDTWFSSALWPHSTLGWPQQTPELKYFYPTSVLITSRDIITLWVARMVLTGLENIGDVPFREVFIHPKILDGDGETMSKSKGNGVDPIDVMEKFGADSLRFGLAYLTTETQDVRMPVDFECPHCQHLVPQTKKNRVLPRVPCKHCGKEFSTQWAEKPADVALPRGAVVSERFELGRNFCNKLWNASRFVMMNLEGYTPAAVNETELPIEDRWILSRLSTVTAGVTEALDTYKFSEAARLLYDFAWDDFCSFYVEMAKSRFDDEQQRPLAQRVIVHTLDALLRLLHPLIPFITEDVWQLLGEVAPERGLPQPSKASESIMVATWPETNAAQRNAEFEARFARFQEVLRALREIRSRQNIPPKTPIRFTLRSNDETAELLQPMAPYFESMAGATATAWGPNVVEPTTCAKIAAGGAEVAVDMTGLIDVEAEIQRNEKELDRVRGSITGKERQLSNENFTSRAPAAVVDAERKALEELRERVGSLEKTLTTLRSQA